MQRKALQVQVELDIHAVTCPGVYLCPNGKVSLQLYMLDSCIQTISCSPIFPVLCHEKFIFYKTFYAAQRLSDLQILLNKEYLYMELIQWQDCEVGNVLASFQTSLSELLYPTTREGSLAGVDIDLLMEPARNFPGVIAPKVEVSTKTIIEDTVCDSKKCTAFVVNPKVIPSKGSQAKNNATHQRKVCHSTGYHRSRKCFPKIRKIGRPPFTYRKVDDTLLARKPQGLGPEIKGKCRCRLIAESNFGRSSQISVYPEKKTDLVVKLPKIKMDCWTKAKTFSEAAKNCLCTSGHEQERCPVCSKYKYYFESSPRDTSPKRDQLQISSGIGKSCALQKSDKHKSCSCEETNNPSNAKVIRCTSPKQLLDDNIDKKCCYCVPQLKPSLAEKLHQRLNHALDSCIDCSCDIYEIDSLRSVSPTYSPHDTILECECPDVNIGDFYRNLYRQARTKIGRQCDRYVTPCCT